MIMKKLLIIDGQEETLHDRAVVLGSMGYDVVPSTGEVITGKFDSVLYVLGLHVDGRSGERMTEIRRVYPKAKLVVYSTEPMFQMYRSEIALAGADILPMIKTPDEIAAALR